MSTYAHARTRIAGVPDRHGVPEPDGHMLTTAEYARMRACSAALVGPREAAARTRLQRAAVEGDLDARDVLWAKYRVRVIRFRGRDAAVTAAKEGCV